MQLALLFGRQIQNIDFWHILSDMAAAEEGKGNSNLINAASGVTENHQKNYQIRQMKAGYPLTGAVTSVLSLDSLVSAFMKFSSD